MNIREEIGRFTFSNFGKFLEEVGDPLPFSSKRVTPTYLPVLRASGPQGIRIKNKYNTTNNLSINHLRIQTEKHLRNC